MGLISGKTPERRLHWPTPPPPSEHPGSSGAHASSLIQIARTNPGTVYSDASTPTATPASRRVALVTGPMLATRTPSSAAALTAAIRFFTVEELVKVIQSGFRASTPPRALRDRRARQFDRLRRHPPARRAAPVRRAEHRAPPRRGRSGPARRPDRKAQARQQAFRDILVPPSRPLSDESVPARRAWRVRWRRCVPRMARRSNALASRRSRKNRTPLTLVKISQP